MRPPSAWRRHWKLAVGFPLVLVLLVGAFGSKRVRAVSSSDRAERVLPTNDVGAGVPDVLDVTRVHAIELRWDDADYRRMLDTYFETGDKAWFEADLVIDGLEVPSVGLRLKGNATLFSLRDADGRTAPNDLPGGAFAPPGGRPGPGGAFGGATGEGQSTEEPEDLPWLVSFDEFVEDRRFQGHEELALRPAQNSLRTTVLNEALSLAVVDDAGEPAPAFAWSSVRVNDRPAALRLVVQHPGDSQVADDFEHDGPLYKSLSTGRFEYRGEDPLAYEDSFEQLTNRRQQDLQPLIDLLRWVTEADDAAFDAGLADRMDVASLARYVALHDLLLNADDMAGPGQNYLLFFDVVTERFTVATWDMNLALRGDPTQGPFEAGAIGGPAGFRPPAGVGPPAGLLGGNVLKERFLASAAFRPRYEEAYRELYRRYFADGRAQALVDELASVLATVDPALVDPADVREDVEDVTRVLADRTRGLAGDALVTG